MATVNLVDAFWLEVVQVAIKIGNQDLAIGNAVRFFRYAQEKHKQGKLITEKEFVEQGFMPELIPIFATRTDDGIVAVGADKHFKWLRDRIMAASKGGSVSSEKKRAASLKREEKKREDSVKEVDQLDSNDFNSLSTSKRQANSSKHKPYSYSYDYSYSLEEGDNAISASPQPTPSMHWLGLLWNEHGGSRLPKLKKTNAHLKNIRLRLKEEPSKEYWVDVIKRIANSDFLTGKTKDPFLATFSWMISKGKDSTLNHVKVMDGNYDNKKPVEQKKEPGNHDYWLTQANLVFQACRRHGFGINSISREFAPQALQVIRAAGGVDWLRSAPDNPFTIRDLAGRLKAAYQNTQTAQSGQNGEIHE